MVPFLWVMAGLTGASGARAEETLRKGPYLMDVRPTSIAVLFECGDPVEAVVEIRSGESEPKSFPSPKSAFHEVVLGGLVPATSYDYTVRAGTIRATGSFTTAPEIGAEIIRFLVMGDNRTNALAHAAVVQAGLSEPADFVLNTGDMIMDGSLDGDWQAFFEVERELLRRTPLFPTLGNHEFYDQGAGVPNFLRYTRVPRNAAAPENYYAFTYGAVRFLVLDSNDDWSRPTAQRHWLEGELHAAGNDPRLHHIMVMTHHGPYSSGYHGSHPGMLMSDLGALLRSEGVSLILSGHDHMYERGDADGLKYVVTGGGGAPLYPENRVLPSQQAFEASYHYLRIVVNGEQVEVTSVRADGTYIEQCSFGGRGPWECGSKAEASARPQIPATVETPRPWPWAWAAFGIAGVSGLLWLLLRWRKV